MPQKLDRKRHRIVIVSGFQIINNPRVVKEADALAEAGYDVTVLSAISSAADLPRISAIASNANWQHLPIVDLSDTGLANRLRNTAMRAAARLSREAQVRFGYDHPMQLGHEILPLLRAARRLNADLYSLHLEKALWVGLKLLSDGRKVRMDVEDWYTEDGLPADRAKRPIHLMRQAEKELLVRSEHTTVTSHAMANALVAAYSCPTPEVIYNSFPTADRDLIDGNTLDRKDTSLPSITWFSQTIGPGRGLETLVQALPLLPAPAELHLRGTPRSGYIDALLSTLPSAWQDRVHIHPQVPQAELLSRLAEHDIGFCGELSDSISRDVTITNKVFEYMRAGLAIVASDTRGQIEVAEIAPRAVHLFAQGDAISLAAALGPIIVSKERQQASAEASLVALKDHFSWEICKERLLLQVDRYFTVERGATAS